MGWTRASQLDRTLQCPGHLTLPHTRTLSEGAQNAADYGTTVHNWKATGVVSGVGTKAKSHEKTLKNKLEILATNGITRETIWPSASASGFHEVSFAYNCVDHRLAVHWGPYNVEWKKSYTDDWIAGTADYVGWTDTGLPWVDDLKTGMLFESQPTEMGQMFFYCMCWNKYNSGVCDVLSSVTHWPKYPLPVLPTRTEGVLTWARLQKFEKYICELYTSGKRPFNLGPECEYCPAFESCPLQKKESI